MATYENLRLQIAALKRPRTNDRREVHWATEARVLGISRTHEDRLEIFLVGPALASSIPSISAALEFGPWWHRDATTPAFEANRLLLPSTGSFDEVTAFVCTELLRNGADTSLEPGFRKTEPIIALVIERLRLSDGALLGLAGELLTLNAIVQQAPDKLVAQVVEAWDGWRQSLRDFSWRGLGVEIKTTSGSSSSHHVQGTHQIEMADGDGADLPESGLLVVSIGLEAVVKHDNSFTVPMLVERIVNRLRHVGRNDAGEVFVDHVREYSGGSGFGYDHRTMSRETSFSRAFETTFVRAYDMTDKNISVLRRSDVVRHEHVDASSIRYTIDLPIRATGDLNPIVGMSQTAAAILGAQPDL